MPFRSANALAIFWELMSIVLHGLGNFVMSYVVGIIIFSASEEERKQHIQKKFDCLRQHNLKFKLSQYKFMQKATQYLGFKISENCNKAKVMRQMLPHTCVRELGSFIGMYS